MKSDNRAAQLLATFLTSPRSRAFVVLAVAGTISLSGAVPAGAHSQLLSSTVAENSILKSAPRTMSVTFNEDVTGKAGCLQLLDTSGKTLAKSGPSVGSTATLKAPVLKPGRYVLRFSVTSPDGHQIVESLAFAVATKTAAASPAGLSLTDAATGPAGLKASINGAAAGLRTVTIPITATEGTLEWRNPLFGAPVLWKMKSDGASMSATGMLPAGGAWSVTARVRVSTFEERVLMGKITIKP